MGVSEQRVDKGEEVTGGQRKWYNKKFLICTLHQILFSNQVKENEWDMQHIWDKEKKYICNI
jgi:hypothetical protein